MPQSDVAVVYVDIEAYRAGAETCTDGDDGPNEKRLCNHILTKSAECVGRATPVREECWANAQVWRLGG